MDIEVRKIQPGDIEYVRQNPLEEAVKNYPEMFSPETSYAGLVDGKIIAVGGVVLFWDGVGEAWLILTKDILDYKLTAYRHIREMVGLAIKHFKLRRLQITVRTDFERAVKMAEKIGFVREGLMIGYCPDGCDAYIYAMVKNEKI